MSNLVCQSSSCRRTRLDDHDDITGLDDRWILFVNGRWPITLSAQNKRGALAISPAILVLPGKHGVSHNSLILIPDVAISVWIVSEEPLAPLIVLLPVVFLDGRCCIILRGLLSVCVLLGV